MWSSYFITWEQRKLGDIFERIVRKNTNNESSLPLTISAQEGLVDQITYFNNRVASRDVSNYYLVLNGEFAYNKSTSDGYPLGAVKRLDLYEKGVLSTLYIVFALRDLSKTDSDYIAVFFDTDRWHRGVAERAAEGARNHGLLNISANDFFDIGISLPGNLAEQQKIGIALKRLDNLITLHQRKYDRFVNIKKALLEKMFPQGDEKVPRIRFKGFTDAWEQRKFGSIVYRASEMSDTDDLPRVEYEDIDAGQGTLNKDLKEKVSTKKGIIFQSGDILYGKLRPYLKNWLFAWFSGIAVGDFWVLRSNQVSQSFIYRLVQTPAFEYIANQSTGSKMPRADWNLVSNTAFAFPTSNEEQEAIGQIFLKLDNLITLHQRK